MEFLQTLVLHPSRPPRPHNPVEDLHSGSVLVVWLIFVELISKYGFGRRQPKLRNVLVSRAPGQCKSMTDCTADLLCSS